MQARFVSEPIEPVRESIPAGGQRIGEPALPMAFRWNDQTIEIAEVVRTWRETGPMRGGGAEASVRKHWHEVTSISGERLKLYFERQPRSASQRTKRWWLYTIEPNARQAGQMQ